MSAAAGTTPIRQGRVRTAGVVVSVSLLIAYSVWSIYYHCRAVRQQLHAPSGAEGPVFDAENRFRDIRKSLPARGIVGYQPEFGKADPDKTLAHYHLAQYVLAPLVLAVDEQRDFNIIESDAQVELKRSDRHDESQP